MHHRSLRVRYQRLFLLFGLVCLLSLHNAELRAEERPLAEALGFSFLDGSSSSLILERDGKQYLIDLATRTIREADPITQVASASTEPQQVTAPAGTSNSGSMIFRQQCASCHGQDGKGTAAGTP